MADPEAPPPVVPPSEADLTMRVVDAETPRTPSAPTLGENKTPSFLVKASAESMSAQSSTQNYDDLLSSMGAEQASEELDPIVMAQDVEILKGRLRSMGRGLLDPRSKLMQYWDFFTLSALFFTSTITPYEVCLMWEETKFADPNWATPPNGPLFVINWIVNLIFMIDICFNFFLPYKESIKKGGGLVKSHRKIAKNYICGWFPLDFVSVIPVDNIMMAVDTSQLRGASLLGAIRMLRLLRLIKLARILRASRIFSRWENSISITYSTQSLIKWGIAVTFMLHMFACLLGLIAQLRAAERSELLTDAVEKMQCGHGCTTTMMDEMFNGLPKSPIDMSRLAVCRAQCLTPCEAQAQAVLNAGDGAYDYEVGYQLNLVVSQENWVCRYVNAGKIQAMPINHGEIWVAGLYVAMIQLGGGVGSIVPENLAEYILFLCCIILGSVTWAMVVGTICATLSTGDPHNILFKQNMDSLNYFLDDMMMPNELRIQAREYLRNTRDLAKKRTYIELMDLLSPALKQTVVLKMSRQMLESVWYFQGIEDGAVVALSLRIERSGYAPREKIPVGQLNILVRGVAAKSGNILTPITTWGEDIIVTSPQLREKKAASALTFVEIASITRNDVDEVLEDFPASAQFIRKAAMKIAMQRAIVVVSEFVKMSRDKGNLADQRQSQIFNAIKTMATGGDQGGSSQVDGVQIMKMITGADRIKEVEELEEEEKEEDSPSMKRPAGDKGDLGAVLKRLDAQEKGLKAMKSTLDQILVSVQSK